MMMTMIASLIIMTEMMTMIASLIHNNDGDDEMDFLFLQFGSRKLKEDKLQR